MEKNTRILIIDDQKDLCEQLSRLLLRSGKPNETFSIVQQMRAKLTGTKLEKEENSDQEEDSPYEVECAYQGQEAVTKIEASLKNEKPFAVVFLDMRMPPGWDGLETAKKIREIDKAVEIVIMTAYADHDQKQIADEVGHPEKLLYIKKPFQPEEIFQLALSLTAKWNLEATEKKRKKWLEAIIKGLCKLKNPLANGSSGSVFSSAQKAFLDLMDSDKAFTATYSPDENKWILQSFSGITEEVAKSFIDKNADFLKETKTVKYKDNYYLLPIRKDSLVCIITVFETRSHGDPEWYKLLSILSMVVTDILSCAVAQKK
jgi:CheY-like chemotaxis protein